MAPLLRIVPPVRILVVSAEPDERESTDTLRVVVEELRRRRDVEVGVWFLRPGPAAARWPDARIVDALRTWPPARMVAAVDERVAGKVRGAVLRRWYRELGANVVLLDDGLGQRLFDSITSELPVIERMNAELPASAALEAPYTGPVAVRIGSAPSATLAGKPTAGVLGNPILYPVEALGRAAVAARRRLRDRTGGLEHHPMVVGWGEDGWIDGADLFVRALWHLEARHQVVANGVWLERFHDPQEADRIRQEAVRCGIADRFAVEQRPAVTDHLGGDVVLLPHRQATEVALLRREQDRINEVAAVGSVVVAFAPADVEAPWVRPVAAFDLDEAARQLALALDEDRQALVDLFRDRHGVVEWADRLLATLTGGGPDEQDDPMAPPAG